MTDEQIKHMVSRFLGWELPEDFTPDGGIYFPDQPCERCGCGWNLGSGHPSGTNLFDATQAEAMVRHMIEGMPAA